MRNRIISLVLESLTVCSIVTAVSAGGDAWVTHHTFEDFAAGTLGNGGQNLYVARAGRVEMIHRLDYNNDGYLDLFVANEDNVIEGCDILVYWGTEEGPRSLMPPVPERLPRVKLIDEILRRRNAATRLPSNGGGRSVLADLNNDGYPEIIFCNFMHNYTLYMDALIFWNSPEGFHSAKRTSLPALLAGGVAASDFNRDGFVDLAFANRGNFEWLSLLKPYGHLESYIYWNGPLGFDAKRRTEIPTVTAVDCVAGDLNGDGYPELIFLNNNRQETSVYLYWGAAEGFSEERREELASDDPRGAELSDLDGDGKLDLIIAHGNDHAEVLRGRGDGFDTEPWAVLPTLGAHDCAVGDLNQDGHTDLVFANKGTASRQVSFIYWGGENGYAEKRRTELPTLEAGDVALADFDSNGWLDVAFSNRSDLKTRDVNSCIYWNGPDGFSPAHRREVLGFSPESVNAADLNRDGHPELVLISHSSGLDGRGGFDSFIYWGNSRHHYSPSSMATLRNCSASGSADLNQDGWVDFIGAYEGVIYFGSSEGFRGERIAESGRLKGQSVSVADLNRDGYLDLVSPMGQQSLYPLPDQEVDPTRGVIFWGSEEGHHPKRTTQLSLGNLSAPGVTIADLNRDRFLDLLFPGLLTGKTNIFWGAADGTYSHHRKTAFQSHGSCTVEVADLDADGWLDLIYGGGWDLENLGRPTSFGMIFWGGREGFSRDRSSKIESHDSLESSVADLNQDGHLDILISNYHAYFTRRLPAFIYWGGSDGRYSASRRTSLPAESSSALTIADFNQDSWLDLFICNHVIEGDHTVGSNIYWGGPEGYSATRRHWVPTFGPHFGLGRDLGNIYDRRLEEEYVSAALQCPSGKRVGRLSWKAQTPHGTAVKLQIRSAVSKKGLETEAWVGPRGSGDYFTESGATLEVDGNHRWLQYRVIFTTPNGGSTAVLEEVSITARSG
jgi:hypothetical protein